MKTIRFFILLSILFSANILSSQNSNLPDADLFTLDGERVSAAGISANDMLTVVLFWNMSDPQSIEQLVTFNEGKDDLMNGNNVKIIGVCTDVNGYMQYIKPFIYGNDIGIDIYIDKNNDLKRMMSVPNTPYTVVFDQENHKQVAVMGSHFTIQALIDDLRSDHLAEGK